MFLEIAILFGVNLLSATFIFHFQAQSTQKWLGRWRATFSWLHGWRIASMF